MASGVDRGGSTGAAKAIVHGDWLDVKKEESEDSKMVNGLNLRE